LVAAWSARLLFSLAQAKEFNGQSSRRSISGFSADIRNCIWDLSMSSTSFFYGSAAISLISIVHACIFEFIFDGKRHLLGTKFATIFIYPFIIPAADSC